MVDDELDIDTSRLDWSKAKRGPVVPLEPGKERITIRLDKDIIDYFRNIVEEAGGGNYQSLINDALRQQIAANRGKLEDMVRKIVRQEVMTALSGRRGAPRKSRTQSA